MRSSGNPFLDTEAGVGSDDEDQLIQSSARDSDGDNGRDEHEEDLIDTSKGQTYLRMRPNVNK